MAITAAGVGSGLDIEGIVSQLMQLERRPLEVLEQRESDTREELSAYGRLKSAISTFKSAMDGLSDVEEFQVYGLAVHNRVFKAYFFQRFAGAGCLAILHW